MTPQDTPSDPPKTPKYINIEDAKTLSVLTNPVRWEILGALMALDKCSAADIARFTARSRTSIYPHLQKLIDAGLVHEAGTQLMGKRYEQHYRPCATTIRTKFIQDDPDNLDFHITFAKALARFMARKYEHAANSPSANSRGDSRNLHCGSHTAWVNKEQLAKLNAMINEIWKFCDATQPGNDTQLLHISLIQAGEPNQAD
jgi:predicted transcriptional regulator